MEETNPPKNLDISNNDIDLNEELVSAVENCSQIPFENLQKTTVTLTKKCKKCHEELDLKFFSAARRNKDGLKHNCKKCDKKLNKNYYNNHREEKIKKAKEWQIANREKYFDNQLNYRLMKSHK